MLVGVFLITVLFLEFHKVVETAGDLYWTDLDVMTVVWAPISHEDRRYLGGCGGKQWKCPPPPNSFLAADLEKGSER